MGCGCCCCEGVQKGGNSPSPPLSRFGNNAVDGMGFLYLRTRERLSFSRTLRLSQSMITTWDASSPSSPTSGDEEEGVTIAVADVSPSWWSASLADAILLEVFIEILGSRSERRKDKSFILCDATKRAQFIFLPKGMGRKKFWGMGRPKKFLSVIGQYQLSWRHLFLTQFPLRKKHVNQRWRVLVLISTNSVSFSNHRHTPQTVQRFPNGKCGYNVLSSSTRKMKQQWNTTSQQWSV